MCFKLYPHVVFTGTREFIDKLALASKFFAEHESTGVLEALSQVRSGYHCLLQTCLCCMIQAHVVSICAHPSKYMDMYMHVTQYN